MTLYERTIFISKKRGYSLKTLAIKAGLAENSIYDWKKSTPKADNLQKVADVLHVSTDYLLGRTDEMNYSSISENKQIDLKDALDDEIMLAFDGRDIPETDKVKIREYIELLDLKRRSEHE
ncbi:helix-turn-helix domain-containing protein [Leuconostoc citreum]|uniref:helix-turn-helix domain-containing protein n=1 Tax=Leuconostoc citreum TaxID=33964 RepID=UPI00105BF791|nr:helix-turn-helix transcriptional regulator [Leuconostoc citreum]MDV8931181.1 helix-turn-helix domain-containing protein [Leuconostoc citreum]TDM36263.1 transcriptional regulator [Leuconostoc citreum]TPF03050.1 transcriptional regulator [Leuconostoc citreum]